MTVVIQSRHNLSLPKSHWKSPVTGELIGINPVIGFTPLDRLYFRVGLRNPELSIRYWEVFLYPVLGTQLNSGITDYLPKWVKKPATILACTAFRCLKLEINPEETNQFSIFLLTPSLLPCLSLTPPAGLQ